MKNFVQSGETLTLSAPTAVASGDIVVVGSIVGVASGSAAVGEDVECVIEGVFTLPKATGTTINQGAKVYWDGTAKKATTTASGNTRLGAATETAASTATIARVRLDGAHT